MPCVTPNISERTLLIRLGNFLKFSTFVLPSFSAQNSLTCCLACSVLVSLASKAETFLSDCSVIDSIAVSEDISVEVSAILVKASAPLDIPCSLLITPNL